MFSRWIYMYIYGNYCEIRGMGAEGYTKRCRLSWLANSALVHEPKCGDEVAGSQQMSTAVHRRPNKLWRSNSIFNLWMGG
jgi:hypothetical protein